MNDNPLQGWNPIPPAPEPAPGPAPTTSSMPNIPTATSGVPDLASAPAPEPVLPMPPVEVAPAPAPTPVPEAPAAPAAPVAPAAPAAPATEQPLDLIDASQFELGTDPLPNNMPTPQQTKFPQPKKANKKLLLIILAAIVLLGGGGAAAFFIMNMPKDPQSLVATAFSNFITSKDVKNTTFTGTGTLYTPDGFAGLGTENINMTISGSRSATTTEAKIHLNTRIDKKDEIDFDFESYRDSDAYYLRLSGLLNDLADTKHLEELSLNRPELSTIITAADGNWYQLGNYHAAQISPCLTQTIAGTDLVDTFAKNNFITAAAYDGTAVKSKKSQVYQVSIVKPNLKVFNAALNNFNDCAYNLDNDLSGVKNIFVEIGDNRLSRFYIEIELGDELNLTIDLSFAYPDTINSSKPKSYENFSDLFNNVIKTALDLDYSLTDRVENEENEEEDDETPADDKKNDKKDDEKEDEDSDTKSDDSDDDSGSSDDFSDDFSWI